MNRRIITADRRTLVAICATICALGCGEEEKSDDFSHLELLPVEEELSEFPLGSYAIPIPGQYTDRAGEIHTRHRVLLRFRLKGLIPPEKEEEVAESWSLAELRLREQIILKCRKMPLDELREKDLVTLKFRITHVLAKQLGKDNLKRVILEEIKDIPM